MSVSLTLVVIMAVLYAAGVYAMLERSLTRVLIGFLLLGNATNLLLLIVMGFPGIAPFAGDEGEQSDPLPQALMLTAIVITFAVSAFLLALIYRSWQLGQADTVEDDAEDLALRMRAAEAERVLGAEGAGDEATTDFVDVVASPLRAIDGADALGLLPDAPVDIPTKAYSVTGPDDPSAQPEDAAEQDAPGQDARDKDEEDRS
ncbi:Na(+)/H(+) antiporter subunit C [Microbacterium marinilacus]|uniref:Na(+)/H(+) antiporter subunit C n=1 Tax=Microbacterium marinilacus TaxID=415209 RepID=A0ABP7BU89_9MICO|nr:Na(+)/H(+) antiporter subunit C [Microbacterium marinilacus]MBY0688210.1 Na(+)/H(+) antiporter subunit C [Microbacterium marinilacus]